MISAETVRDMVFSRGVCRHGGGRLGTVKELGDSVQCIWLGQIENWDLPAICQCNSLASASCFPRAFRLRLSAIWGPTDHEIDWLVQLLAQNLKACSGYEFLFGMAQGLPCRMYARCNVYGPGWDVPSLGCVVLVSLPGEKNLSRKPNASMLECLVGPDGPA